MKKVILLAENSNLLADMQEVFGDVLENAFVAYVSYGSPDNGDMHKVWDDAQSYADNEIPTGGEIVLKLKNGKTVKISTSEWGFVESVKDEMRLVNRNKVTEIEN